MNQTTRQLIAGHLANFYVWLLPDSDVTKVDTLVEEYMEEQGLELGSQSYHCSEHALETDHRIICIDCSAPARYLRPRE